MNARAVVRQLRARAGRAKARLRRPASRRDVFTGIYKSGAWGSDETVSGVGSALDQTERLRVELPPLLRQLGIRSMIDVPCGDFHWMRNVDLEGIDYLGLDLVPAIVRGNQRRYGGPGVRFATTDVVRARLPRVDLILCRDLLVHLTLRDIRRALANMQASGSTWLLTTTFFAPHPYSEIPTGSWRPLNLELEPFGFPPPTELLVEGCTLEDGKWPDKSLGLWRLADLPMGDRRDAT